MAKASKRIALDTTAPAPSFDPNMMDVSIVRELREFYSSVAKDEDGKPVHTQRSDLEVWTWYANARQQYPNAGRIDWFKSVAQRIANADTADENTSERAIVDDSAPLDKASQFIVDTLNADAEFVAFNKQLVEAKTIVGSVLQQYTVRLLTDFATVGNAPWELGNVGAFLSPSLDALPEPASKEPTDKEKAKIANFSRPKNGWDIEWKYVNGKLQQVSRYREIVRRWPEGVRIRAEIAECNDGIANKGPYKDNSKQQLVEHVEYLDGQITALARHLRDAVSIVRMMQAVNNMTKLACNLVTYENVMPDKTTKIELSIDPKKVRVYETRKGGNEERYTIADFLRLRPAIAEEKGGTLGELRTSPEPTETAEEKAKREGMAGQGASQSTSTDTITLLNVALFAERFGAFFDTNPIPIQQKLNDPDLTKSDPMLAGILKAYCSIDAMLRSHPDYRTRGEKLLGLSDGSLSELMGIKANDKPKLNVA